MGRLIFLCVMVLPAVVLVAWPRGAEACNRGGGTSTGSAMASSAAGNSNAAAALSAARAMALSRSAMFRSYGRVGHANNPGYGSLSGGSGNVSNGAIGRTSSPTSYGITSSPPRSKIMPSSNVAPAVKDPPADSPALDLPTRDWIVSGDTGDKVVSAQFVGLLDGKVLLRKGDGHITLAAFDQLSDPDQKYVSDQTGRKTAAAVAQN